MTEVLLNRLTAGVTLALLAIAIGAPPASVAQKGRTVTERAGPEGTAESPRAGQEDVHEPVLLEETVADFKHIADHVAGHRIEMCVRGADEDVYPQPYCYLTALLVQMHAAGWDQVDLDLLAAVSGASAMFGYESGEFMPKYAFHRRGPNDLVARATGYATESVRVADAEHAWHFVRESVGSGRPAAGWRGEMMLLACYHGAESAADRKVFAMQDGNDYFAEWWDWNTFAEWVGDGQHVRRHAGRVEPEPPLSVARRVIGDLIALSRDVPEHIQQAFPGATFGLAGIEAWAADCADLEKHPDWGMCHSENPQWTVRNSSAAYLGGLAEGGTLSSQASRHVQDAAANYRAAYQRWQVAYGLVGYAAPDGSGRIRENRLAAARAVRQARKHEQSAIGELEDALAELGP